MPKHDLYLNMPAKTLLHKDAELEVYSDDNKLGTLRMSQGSIEWVPARSRTGYHRTWEEFDSLMRGK